MLLSEDTIGPQLIGSVTLSSSDAGISPASNQPGPKGLAASRVTSAKFLAYAYWTPEKAITPKRASRSNLLIVLMLFSLFLMLDSKWELKYVFDL